MKLKIEFTKNEKRFFYVVYCITILVTIVFYGVNFIAENYRVDPMSIEALIGMAWLLLTFYGIVYIIFRKVSK